MHVSFALFADAANVSQEGKLNVLGVFDSVHVAGFPAVHPRAHLVVRLKGSHADVGAHVVGLQWRNPQGTELWSTSGELNVGAPPIGTGEMDLPIIAALDLPLDGPGTYTMGIALDAVARTEIKLQVHAGAPQMPGGGLVS
ncbi:MAG TPA: hypothetical protein VFW98_12125 [Gemmatimonadaceae bacterium]|nr:hypothetical protein [Gemmatimonadaceae bacterium]